MLPFYCWLHTGETRVNLDFPGISSAAVKNLKVLSSIPMPPFISLNDSLPDTEPIGSFYCCSGNQGDQHLSK
jgi:hypothetical protein